MFRAHYWSCSKFADWVRGTPKLRHGTEKEWRTWRKDAQSAHKFRYWVAEKLLDRAQDFVNYIPDRIHDVQYYLRIRFIIKTHSIGAHPRDIQPGTWSDVGNRFLPCLFNALVNYVEVELAWNHIRWGENSNRKKYGAPRWFSRLSTWRSKEAGLDNLKWQCSLTYDDDWMPKTDPRYGKPTPQAEMAQQILQLYLWWTEIRPNREDPYDESGWNKLYDSLGDRSLFDEDLPPDMEEEKRVSHDKLGKIEEDNELEDEEMMIRLIKIRQCLWT